MARLSLFYVSFHNFDGIPVIDTQGRILAGRMPCRKRSLIGLGMNSEIWKVFGIRRKLFVSFILPLLICAIAFGCRSTKKLTEETKIIGTDQKSSSSIGSDGATARTSKEDFGLDDHFRILINPEGNTSQKSDLPDSLTETVKIEGESEISSQNIVSKELEIPDFSEAKSAVADKIVENYLNSKNKSPGGHCLVVSKARFEKAYEDVHGHPVYKDLPDSMITPYYTPREVFDYLYASASGTHDGWRSLPIKYRGKGNAGAITYAGMGTLVDWFGIWNGELRPGALIQVWRRRTDYELVVRGVNKKDFDPFGHSFIFMGYVRDEKNEIIGIKIADQGYQDYRPLLPNDYEVWWAVNLTI